MDPGYRSPLVDLFRQGAVPRDVKLLAASGALAPRAHEQLAILVLLTTDADPLIAAQAAATIDHLPRAALSAFLAREDVPDAMREFFAARGVAPAAAATDDDASEPLIDMSGPPPDTPEEGEEQTEESRLLSALSITDRIKLAMKGTREQRAQLIRDPNRMVAAAVLSSPKLTESEIEAFARMANVSDEVLRVIGTNRAWLKNYGVAAALTRNPKTPPAISLQLLHRLNDRDVKTLATDRNVPEVVRLAARKITVKKLG